MRVAVAFLTLCGVAAQKVGVVHHSLDGGSGARPFHWAAENADDAPLSTAEVGQ